MHSEEDQKKLEQKAKQLLKWGIFAFLASIVIIVFLPLAVTKWNWISIGVQAPNEIGDTLGGIMGPAVALLGVALTFLAFWAQYVANQEQRQQFLTSLQKQEKDRKDQQFESQFFEMLRLHKENVDELAIIPIGGQTPVTRRMVFQVMTSEFNQLLGLCAFGQPLKKEEFVTAYNIFFWGYDEGEVQKLSSPSEQFIRGDQEGDKQDTINFKQHSGYSGQLGHYFRHLFMMVKFVVKSKVIIDYDEKMQYLKMLRAQLSNYEQIMLFYNWLSSGYGGAWENDDNNFFSTYKMIHNLWTEELYQDSLIVNAVNSLIDTYNKNPKKTPLFEFQGTNFDLKMKDVENPLLPDIK